MNLKNVKALVVALSKFTGQPERYIVEDLREMSQTELEIFYINNKKTLDLPLLEHI